jgi:nicotinate-nucleotide adenylyltransferase
VIDIRVSSDSMVERIGMFGGTFDPIHVGHLLLAERAREELGLDHILFVPANVPPHKRSGRLIAPPESRLEMLRLAIAGNPAFEISTHEIDREGVSYTVDTLRHFEAVRPTARFTLLIGGDNAGDFATWRDPEQIVRLASVAVWARPGSQLPAELLPGVGYHRIDSPLLEISSTDIRSRAAAGRSIRYMVPDAVADYITRHELYR